MFNPDQVAPIKPTNRAPQTDGLGKTRPQGPPKSDKDFRRLIRDDDSDTDHSNTAVKDKGKITEKEDDETPSLFDLAKKQPLRKDSDTQSDSNLLAEPEEADLEDINEESVVAENVPKTPVDTSTKLAANQLIREEVAKESILAERPLYSLTSETDSTTLSPKDKAKKVKSDSSSDFIQEKTDLAYVNQLSQGSVNDVHAYIGDDTEQVSHSQTVQELINQMVDAIQVIKKGNETETMVTLKHPPILSGANINLSTLNSANGEFNVAFTNLTPDGKTFLDQKLVGDSLTLAMERKGFVIHIVTTSTSDAPLIQTDGEKFAQNQERQQQQQQDQRNRQFYEEEERT